MIKNENENKGMSWKDNNNKKTITHHMGFLYLFILFFKNEDLKKNKKGCCATNLKH
jgi:hypothetical protein